MIMNTQFKASREAALASGLRLANMRMGTGYEIKAEAGLGIHAIVTAADLISHKEILRTIITFDKRALFITEEHVEGHESRIITPKTLSMLKDTGAYIIDELDGTSPYIKGHHEWSVSIGFVNTKLEHTAGVVFAPKIDGGTLFYASTDEGSFVTPNCLRYSLKGEYNYFKGLKRVSSVSGTISPKEAYVVGGPDCFLSQYPIQRDAILSIADKVRTINSVGSCALGLGLVATGRIDALMQPLHYAWDWAAGKALVELAGGTLQFYEVREGIVEPVNQMKLEYYDPSKRTAGFVAGNRTMASFVLDELTRASKRLKG